MSSLAWAGLATLQGALSGAPPASKPSGGKAPPRNPVKEIVAMAKEARGHTSDLKELKSLLNFDDLVEDDEPVRSKPARASTRCRHCGSPL